jgi:N-methylhydantoinase A
MAFFVGTDVGGTFTDLWVADAQGEARVFKTPTTPDVIGGVVNAIEIAAQSHGLDFGAFCSRIKRFGHGNTVSLNALLTGRAAKTAVVTTHGFGDTLEIGRMRRQTAGLSDTEVTDYFLHNRHPPIIPRHLVIEVNERIDANGNIIAPLDEPHAREAIRALGHKGVEAVAICTLWSTANPVHELRLKAIVEQELPVVFLSVSHEISSVVGE